MDLLQHLRHERAEKSKKQGFAPTLFDRINGLVKAYALDEAFLRENQLGEAVQQIIEFDETPADLKAHMDRFVIGQEQGKKIVAVAIAYHYRRLGSALEYAMVESGDDLDVALRNTATPKANILVVGPTGCGKTYTGDVASRMVGVPFAIEDLTKFSEVG